MRKIKQPVWKIRILSIGGNPAINITLDFTQSHYAEQVLRGLVHSGYQCAIWEELEEVEVEDEAKRPCADETTPIMAMGAHDVIRG